MFNLKKELALDYGTHRSGWSYAVNCLKSLHDPNAPELVSFVEKKFIFGDEPGERLRDFENIQQPWIGFMHVPVNVPRWFLGHYSPIHLMEDSDFKVALKHCKGLFTLSTPLGSWLKQQVNVPVSVVLHPTEEVDLKFNPEKYFSAEKRQIVQLGWWLRKLNAIHQLQLPKALYQKKIVGISKPYQKQTALLEKNIFGFENYTDEIEHLGFMEDDIYDAELSKSIVFVDFYDTAANNAIIECIVRAVPILCPPLLAVVDYLGEDYPFYYKDYDDARKKLASDTLILEAHNYLLNSGIAERLTPEFFLQSIRNSEIMASI